MRSAAEPFEVFSHSKMMIFKKVLHQVGEAAGIVCTFAVSSPVQSGLLVVNYFLFRSGTIVDFFFSPVALTSIHRHFFSFIHQPPGSCTNIFSDIFRFPYKKDVSFFPLHHHFFNFCFPPPLLICLPLNAHTLLMYAARIRDAIFQKHCVVSYL